MDSPIGVRELYFFHWERRGPDRVWIVPGLDGLREWVHLVGGDCSSFTVKAVYSARCQYHATKCKL